MLSINPNAIRILEDNLDKSDFTSLELNLNAYHLVVPLNHQAMKDSMKLFAEELVAYVFNPDRLFRAAERFGIDLDELLELY